MGIIDIDALYIGIITITAILGIINIAPIASTIITKVSLGTEIRMVRLFDGVLYSGNN